MITTAHLMEAVTASGSTLAVLRSSSRLGHVVRPRQEAFAYLHHLGYSLTQIGLAFGRSHTTVGSSLESRERRRRREGARTPIDNTAPAPDEYLELQRGYILLEGENRKLKNENYILARKLQKILALAVVSAEEDATVET